MSILVTQADSDERDRAGDARGSAGRDDGDAREARDEPQGRRPEARDRQSTNGATAFVDAAAIDAVKVRPLRLDELYVDALQVDLHVTEERLVVAIQDRDAYRILAYQAIDQLAIVTEELKRAKATIASLRACWRQVPANTRRPRARVSPEPAA